MLQFENMVEGSYESYYLSNQYEALLSFREIGRMDSKDLTKDTSGTRAFAAFLVDLAEKIPDLMLPSISVLLGLLDGEVKDYLISKTISINTYSHILYYVYSKSSSMDTPMRVHPLFRGYFSERR